MGKIYLQEQNSPGSKGVHVVRLGYSEQNAVTFFCFDIVKLFCDRFWSNTPGGSALITLSPLTETSPAVSGVCGWGTAGCVKVEQCFTRGHSVTFFRETFALPSLCGTLVTVIIQRSPPSRHLYFRQMFA